MTGRPDFNIDIMKTTSKPGKNRKYRMLQFEWDIFQGLANNLYPMFEPWYLVVMGPRERLVDPQLGLHDQ